MNPAQLEAAHADWQERVQELRLAKASVCANEILEWKMRSRKGDNVVLLMWSSAPIANHPNLSAKWRRAPYTFQEVEDAVNLLREQGWMVKFRRKFPPWYWFLLVCAVDYPQWIIEIVAA